MKLKFSFTMIFRSSRIHIKPGRKFFSTKTSQPNGKSNDYIGRPNAHFFRYAGLPTFMGVDFNPKISDLASSGADIAFVGVPYDGGVTNRPGTRHGPRELRNNSSLTRGIHSQYRFDPFDLCKIVDCGDVNFNSVFNHEKVVSDISRTFQQIAATGTIPIAAGGDHSITYPILKGLLSSSSSSSFSKPVGIIHIDAHTDTWSAWQDSKFHHGSPFYLGIEEGLIDPKRMIQIGIRGSQNIDDGWKYCEDNGIRVITIEEFEEIGVDNAIAEARRVIGNQPCYLSFDIDALDPSCAPGTGTPECGGFTTREVMKLLRGFRGLDFIGADLVEVSPPFDHGAMTSIAGVTVMYEQLCLIADQLSHK